MNLFETIKLTLSIISISLITLLIVQVLAAQIIVDTLVTALDASDSLLTLIIFGFFILTLLVNVLITYFITVQKRAAILANLFAFCTTIIIVIAMAFIAVEQDYDVIPVIETGSVFWNIVGRGYAYLIAIPQMVSIYAIYELTSIQFFYVLVIIIYSVTFSVFAGGMLK